MAEVLDGKGRIFDEARLAAAGPLEAAVERHHHKGFLSQRHAVDVARGLLQEVRHVLEILGDQRIPYEGERKRFRAEGDFLVRALVDLTSQCRAHLGRLEGEFADLERSASSHK